MNYFEALANAIKCWNLTPIADEWLFENFREEVVNSMSSSEAFEAIGGTIEILLRENDESTATEIVQTIIGLANRSETTEIPIELLTRKTVIQDQFNLYGEYAQNKLKELFKYYRL